ncbi:MAG: hypothetical protein JWM41_1013 [Gemmatimonadetes bacterium]|nr:hypothetical protein [Gemmatimonadota bacterium]
MPILTIYNHGTGGSRTKPTAKLDIVNLFGNGAQGTEGIDFIITEGVGKTGRPDAQLVVEHVHGGTFAGIMGVEKVTPSKARVSENLRAATGGGASEWIVRKAGTDAILGASGVGADENVVSVVNQVTGLVRAGTPPTSINMMGWSRGAVTCIRIAYFLSKVERMAAIPINIFAVDPVAGKGHDAEIDARTITPNVRNYVATVAVHENRAGFTPMDNSLLNVVAPDRTAFAVLPMPGLHDETARYGPASGKLTFNLCARFLANHETRLHSGLRAGYFMTNAAVLEEYDKLLVGTSAGGVKSEQSWKKRLTGGGTQRRGVYTAADPTATFFINAHHKAVFQQAYPMHFAAYFGAGAAQKGTIPWQNQYRRQLFEEARHMGRGHTAGIARQLNLRASATNVYLSQAYLMAVTGNGLVG